MFRKILLIFYFVILLNPMLFAQQSEYFKIDPLDNMPILKSDPLDFGGNIPVPQRDSKFTKYLSASVKVHVRDASGSGTIIYYDPIKKLAYVASCGHLWQTGVMTAAEGKRKNIKCKVEVWFHSNLKIAPKTYEATVLFYSHYNLADSSLLVFTPDWIPNYFPIAPVNYKYIAGKHAHSLGCDSGSEVAHYDVILKGISKGDLVTYSNSPRPGRSGGGLMDDDGYYIATCVKTEFTNGTGDGFFTPLSFIHKFWQEQGYGFLLKKHPAGMLARKISIKDRTEKQGVYSKEYILIPN